MRFRVFLLVVPLALLFAPASSWAWLPPPFALQWGEPGSGPGEFNVAYDLAVDGAGNVYVVDLYNSRVQKFDSSGNYITSFAVNAFSVAVNTNGNILVVTNGNAIDEFTSSGSLVRQWTYPQFAEAWGIAVDADGFIYVSDSQRNKIDKFTNDGTFVMSWGSAGHFPGQLSTPGDLGVDNAGLIYVADQDNDRVQRFDSQGTLKGVMGGSGSGPNQFSRPVGIAADALGYVYVTDLGNHRVQVYRGGGWVAQWGTFGSGAGQFESPRGIGVNSNGAIYVSDFGTDHVQKFANLPVPTEAVTLGRVKALYRGAKATSP